MKKQLVKPSSIKDRVAKEVESLCDGFSCTTNLYGPYNPGPGNCDTGGESEILF